MIIIDIYSVVNVYTSDRYVMYIIVVGTCIRYEISITVKCSRNIF